MDSADYTIRAGLTIFARFIVASDVKAEPIIVAR